MTTEQQSNEDRKAEVRDLQDKVVETIVTGKEQPDTRFDRESRITDNTKKRKEDED